ncbi:FAD:protein FMN transferase [Senegalimassilia anaerobia]|uniref:FAD:protein FMN transferase n=1 Tax=Senegalimassilia anaerobia TaxID=1473216 RepID=A0A369LEM7_9ACTN|nr:FAD:protein FMN transferase [Senegalimassilia anaerobia]RDB56595.1 thiamine biosynthesis protein ApbE [Senegalimassilia anaerobia]
MENGTISRRRFLMLAAGSVCAMAMPAWLAGCSAGQNGEGDGATADDGADSAAYEVQSLTLFLFDTVIQISALCAPELMDRLSERCQFFEDRFSRTKEGSDIWNINQAHGAPVEVSEETARCIEASLAYSEASDGLFDISIGAVSSLWDFVEGIKPDDDAIKEAVKHVDYRTISVDGTTVTLADPDAMLDLGGIAKGFITDDLVSMLREAGCKSAMLSLGGNVYVLGESFRGDDWNVGVQDPNGTANDVIASIPARDKSLVTSGLYERSFTIDDVLYYHILDPRTGYPAKTDLASASIVSDSSTDGDAYSTTLFLMGHDKAMDLLNSDERFSGLLIDMNDTATASNGSGFTLLSE